MTSKLEKNEEHVRCEYISSKRMTSKLEKNDEQFSPCEVFYYYYFGVQVMDCRIIRVHACFDISPPTPLVALRQI